MSALIDTEIPKEIYDLRIQVCKNTYMSFLPVYDFIHEQTEWHVAKQDQDVFYSDIGIGYFLLGTDGENLEKIFWYRIWTKFESNRAEIIDYKLVLN